MLLSVSAVSIPAFAQEEGAGFENFLLSSPSIVSPSQHYQVTAGRFEALAGLLSGSYEVKPGGTEIDLEGQSLAAAYHQALGQMVLGADIHYDTSKQEGGGFDLEGSETAIRPSLAFAISPIFSLGASINIFSGEDDYPTGSESYNYNTFTVGGTLHQGPWEASLALSTANEDDDKSSANAPQTIIVHGRYKVLPVLALGLRYDQADYPGIEQPTQTLETETSYSLILESAVSDNSRVEVAFRSFSNSSGIDGSDLTQIFLSGGFDLAPNMELGAQLQFVSGESDTSESSITGYALTFAMIN
ncbi:hypothetical protein [Oligoflexus tunisiensis]|uniref:hypothetical protein n=1 Tax=Oligoflexus tunisiensis TaxID=708132 RepID=UPI001C406C21|nr:hypothetical protein [Oligoflexus tunisiensis]